MSDKILAMILAGGEGRRLYPLTAERSKPAVPFGGCYRIIDFVLSNFINSDIGKIKVLTQFMADSLIRHLARSWPLSPLMGDYIDPIPAQMRTGRDWYRGTADAIYQNLHAIRNENPHYVLVFGGDHIYRMDVRQMIDFHKEKGAAVTVAAIPFPREKSSPFGVIEVDADGRIVGFEEKPADPKPIPGDPDMSLVSMGNYVFDAATLTCAVSDDAGCESAHDFGKDIITGLIGKVPVYVYDFSTNEVPGMEPQERGYWRDVGDLDQYWEASMDLVSVSPIFNLYNREWPILGFHSPSPPAKFVFADIGRRAGLATDSLVGEGCVVSGGRLDRCVVSPHCRINSYSIVEESILMEGVVVGRDAKLRRVIVDKGVAIPPGASIGYDRAADLARYTVTPGGVTVVPKGSVVEPVE
jgi:glucose-1-phosphate adenylyltransferase